MDDPTKDAPEPGTSRPSGPTRELPFERRRYTSDNPPDAPRERRRPGWSEFRRAYPGVIAVALVAIVGFLALDAWMLAKRQRYEREIARLRADMTGAERQRADIAYAANENRVRVMLELVRRQARLDEALHLSVAVDSGMVLLEREGALLRVIQAEIGPERWVGEPPDTVLIAVPRGKRTVERVLGPDAAWEVPAWVYRDRGLPVPEERTLQGALGPAAVVLDGGTVIYTMPTVGPLNDSSYVLPGGVRVPAGDLRAVLPNLQPGTAVYFY